MTICIGNSRIPLKIDESIDEKIKLSLAVTKVLHQCNSFPFLKWSKFVKINAFKSVSNLILRQYGYETLLCPKEANKSSR